MKAKNNNSIPTDDLWKPSIHDLAPVITLPKKNKKKGKKPVAWRNKLVRMACKTAGLPSTKVYTVVKMAANVVESPLPAKSDIRGHILVLEAFIELRGGVIKRPKKLATQKKQCFYKSPQWRQLRYKIIQKHGARCMACKADDKPIHVDHIKPRSKHPELELDEDNLQILCEDCNLGKLHLDDTDWR